jgi:AbrB family looped-hinge helix DNA binding protein
MKSNEIKESTGEYVSTVGEAGRVVIPAPLRKALSIEPGGAVRMQVQRGKLLVTPESDTVRAVQAIARRRRPEGRMRVSDALIEERREEARRDG